MKVFVFGANGMLGTYIAKYLSSTFDVVKITRSEFDIINDSSEKLKGIISRDSVIINCAGIIPQRTDETNIREYIKVNSLFPHKLQYLSEILDSQLIHITTDCVYDGSAGDYSEDDIHTEMGLYGVSKSCGEPESCMNIRCSIIGESETGKGLLEWVKNNRKRKISGYTNHMWNGVTCLYLSRFIENTIISKCFWRGTRHLCSESISKFKLCEMISKIYELECIVKPVQHTNYSNKVLISKFIEKVDKSLEQQLIEQRDFFYGVTR